MNKNTTGVGDDEQIFDEYFYNALDAHLIGNPHFSKIDENGEIIKEIGEQEHSSKQYKVLADEAFDAYEADEGNEDDDENEEGLGEDNKEEKELEIPVEVSKELLLQGDQKEQQYKIVYSNGDVYIGEMVDELKEGWGVYQYSNGEKYEGLWQNDMLHGMGTYFFLEGHSYQGDWWESRKEGIGILTLANGDRYEGEFYRDEMDGKGKYFYANGDEFEGKFQKGKKEGEGRLTLASDGRLIIGEWAKDVLQPF